MVLKGLLTGQGIKSNAMILNAHVWGYDNLTKATLLVASLSSGTVYLGPGRELNTKSMEWK